MPIDMISSSNGATKECYEVFQEAYACLDYDRAASAFQQALERDPAWAFRYFVSYASAALSTTLLACSDRKAQVVRMLDALITEHPYAHYLGGPADPIRVQRVVALREKNINAGLPSIIIVPQGKSASVSVSAIFASGFSLPSVCYSLVNLDIIDSWVADYARGGACYATHLIPSTEKVAQIKRAGINKMIVHVRDPRQALVSIVHHLDRYPDQMPGTRRRVAQGRTVSERAQHAMKSYQDSIRWISGWADAEDEIEILFSTHEQFVQDRDAFIDRYLDFYGADRKYFSHKDAIGQHAGIDYHFRSGSTDEWQHVLEPAFADQISAMLPERLKAKFGWPDRRSHLVQVAWPSPRDRFMAWLYDGDDLADKVGLDQVRRLREAGDLSPPPELEEMAVRARLREVPDNGVLLMRLWGLMQLRDAAPPGGLPVHALRSRLTELSEATEGGDPATLATRRAAIEKELAVQEAKDGLQANTGQPSVGEAPTKVDLPSVATA